MESFVIVDDKIASKSLDNDLGRPTSCPYSRGPYSSFDRDRNDNNERAENRFRDYSDSLANILPSWFEKDGVKRSHSNVSAKRVELSPINLTAEKTGHNNGKDPFQRNFPSLGSEEKEMDFEVVRVPSPVLSSAVGGHVWTSAVADAPVAETNGPTSISATANVTADRNMAETPPQMSVGSQRLEELAVKQSIKLHILKPSRERSSAIPIAKENSSPTGGGKLPNSPLAAPLDRKKAFTSEKRPSPQAKSRNDFFNLMRKKSMSSAESTKLVEGGTDSGGENVTKNGKNDFILYSEEEEARFLRSLGWEETTEEGGLTEEEINSFYRDVSKYVNSRMGFKGTQPKCLMPIIHVTDGEKWR